MIRTVNATRYVRPLREGGSLPAIIEADDDGMYVLKFRSAAQGPKALIAELIGGGIGRALGLPVPELVFVEFDGALGRNEPHAEIQDLVVRSAGLNLALDYLPGSFNFDPLNASGVDPELAARIVWFDAYITNVDRTPRNPNMLLWHRNLWLIDHGAALYMHHTWADWQSRARGRFQPIKEHILLRAAGDLETADAALAPLVTKSLIAELVGGAIGRALGLPVPEIVFVEFDGALGRNEPHAEIQELVVRSAGLNLALDYLPGSFNFDPLNVPEVDPALAARIVWFDAYITNVDRTPRNPNMLLWHRNLWLIDHGAALYIHHTWADWRSRARGRFQPIKDHILLRAAGDLRAADEALAPLVTPALIADLVAAIPDAWLEGEPAFADVGEHRAAYAEYLRARIEAPRLFVEEAADARAQRL